MMLDAVFFGKEICSFDWWKLITSICFTDA